MHETAHARAEQRDPRPCLATRAGTGAGQRAAQAHPMGHGRPHRAGGQHQQPGLDDQDRPLGPMRQRGPLCGQIRGHGGQRLAQQGEHAHPAHEGHGPGATPPGGMSGSLHGIDR
ncbi:hypothetical protein [Tepidimonas sp. HKU77]|uniref:hypothetical protein n=1 Tax=unclassified Tepidimonas TaxID=2631705 RepID=UPI003C7DC882